MEAMMKVDSERHRGKGNEKAWCYESQFDKWETKEGDTRPCMISIAINCMNAADEVCVGVWVMDS